MAGPARKTLHLPLGKLREIDPPERIQAPSGKLAQSGSIRVRELVERVLPVRLQSPRRRSPHAAAAARRTLTAASAGSWR